MWYPTYNLSIITSEQQESAVHQATFYDVYDPASDSSIIVVRGTIDAVDVLQVAVARCGRAQTDTNAAHSPGVSAPGNSGRSALTDSSCLHSCDVFAALCSSGKTRKWLYVTVANQHWCNPIPVLIR